MVGLIRGKYRIVREIARSNDIVYEAWDEALGRRIAIKVLNIPPNLTGAARRDRIERFSREARAAGRLSHPNIVAVYDYGEENGFYFIAMEYLEGQSLRDILAVQGALPVNQAVDIACQALEALAYAHANNVVHRDIKPDNIHISNGKVKLTDFGIARLMEEPALTRDGQIFGTPSYMSPEQIEGRSIDFRSDLFSLGVVLYEMLTGRKPFTGDSVVSITYGIMNADPPPLIGIPYAVEQVVRRALAKNPALRPSSAEAMRQELLQAIQTPVAYTSMPSSFPTVGPHQQSLLPNSFTSSSPSPAPVVPALAPPVIPSAPAIPAGGNVGSNGLKWQWSKQGSNDPSMAAYASMPLSPGGFPTGVGPGMPLMGPPASWGYPQPSFSIRFSLPPGLKAFLNWALISIVLGVLLAIGVIFFLRSYQAYQQQQNMQRVQTIMREGNKAYAQGDYKAAQASFLKALRISTNASQTANIKTDLAYTYVQLARKALEYGDRQTAEEDYRAALQYAPGYATAHLELSQLLRGEGREMEAQQESQLAQQNSSSNVQPPTSLTNNIAPLPGTWPAQEGNTANVSSADFIAQRRQQAQEDINEANQLISQGDTYGAERKLEDAVDKGAGLPEGEQAQQLLNQLHGMNNATTNSNFGDLGGGF